MLPLGNACRPNACAKTKLLLPGFWQKGHEQLVRLLGPIIPRKLAHRRSPARRPHASAQLRIRVQPCDCLSQRSRATQERNDQARSGIFHHVSLSRCVGHDNRYSASHVFIKLQR